MYTELWWTSLVRSKYTLFENMYRLSILQNWNATFEHKCGLLNEPIRESVGLVIYCG